MAIRVQIPSPLRPLTGGAAELLVEADHVSGLIDALAARHPGMGERLRQPGGELRAYVRVFVNDEDIRFLQDEATALESGDTVAIIPAIAGG